MKNIVAILFIFSFCNASVAQFPENPDSVSRRKADEVLFNYFNRYLDTNRILLFSISDKTYYIILEKEHCYEEYFFQSDSDELRTPTLVCSEKKPNMLLKKAFSTNIYHRGYVTYVKDPELQQGRLSYFVLRDAKGERFGEYRESLIIKPAPIDNKVYSYLLTKIMNATKTVRF